MKVIIRYKNGFELPVECKEFLADTDGFNNLIGCRIKGIKGNKPLYISIEDVMCIWREGEADKQNRSNQTYESCP
jgi:hypothetical protein